MAAVCASAPKARMNDHRAATTRTRYHVHPMKQPDLTGALKVLKSDPRMARLMKRYGRPDLTRYHKMSRTLFASLVRSIVYQQVSGHAARAIHARVVALFPGGKPTPEQLLKIRAPQLRKAGLSVQKIAYVKDLAKKCLDGTIDEKQFAQMSSQEIIEHLVAVKGIGEWTAQMMLIFKLYRLDILPVGDLAIRKGFQKIYGLKKEPDRKTMERLATPWRAYATVASWYLWRAMDEAKDASKEKAAR